MSDTYTNLKYHLIWSTKERRAFLNEQIQEDLYSYMAGITNNLNGYPHLINGTNNHVHILLGLPPNMTLSNTVQKIKSRSSAWVNEQEPGRTLLFRWQSGYSAFTVSQSRVDDVYTYIDRQEEHHQTVSFDEEYKQFLDRNEVDYNEEYLL